MGVNEVIWLAHFLEKIERKHGVTADELDQVFARRPRIKRIERGVVNGEHLHDSAEYDDSMRDVEPHVKLRGRRYMVPVDGELYRKLELIVKETGISTERLVNMWIQEKAS